ncbi:MAG: hypothetical protein WCC08_07670 [Terrimicrobiaceae bacterium]
MSGKKKSPRPSGNKQGGTAAPPQTSQEERDVEMMGVKAIQFVRQGSEDYWVTYYGSHDATDYAFVREEKIGGKRKTVYGTTLLVRHERRGKSSWVTVCNGRQNVSGKVAISFKALSTPVKVTGSWRWWTI